jgi:hypothetical protein
MKLHEQVDTLRTAVSTAMAECIRLEAALLRKTGCPYPDGTCDNKVNIETDVLPTLHEIRANADRALMETLRKTN